jgi:hypothetical protein
MVHVRDLLRPGFSREEQVDLVVPEKWWRLAPQDHTAVVLPHVHESCIRLRYVPPPY